MSDSENNKPDNTDFNENPSELWLSDDEWVADLNLQWRTVIDGIMDRKPFYVAYGEAYDIDISTDKGKNLASASSSRLIRNARFKQLWRRVIEERGFNDETVDWELTRIMNSKNVTERDRLIAIKEYNNLQGRITKKNDITSDGNPIMAILDKYGLVEKQKNDQE